MAYQQRDIVLVHFPFTDLSNTKLRPAIVLSSASINSLGDFVCAQITSQRLTDDTFFPLLPKMLETALPLTSGIRMHKLFCLSEKLIVHKVSSIYPQAFYELTKKINGVVFGFEPSNS